MSSPNSNKTYAGAVKKTSDNKCPGSSSDFALDVTLDFAAISSVAKRKREDSSSSVSSSSSSNNSSTPSNSNPCPAAALNNFKYRIGNIIVESPPQGLNSVVNCAVRRKKYINDVCNKFIRDHTHPPKSVTTQTETDDELIEACIQENELLKVRDEKLVLSSQLQVEREHF